MLSSPSCFNNAYHGYLVLPLRSFLIISLFWNRVHALVPLLPSQPDSYGMPLPIFFHHTGPGYAAQSWQYFIKHTVLLTWKYLICRGGPWALKNNIVFLFHTYLSCFQKWGKENWSSSTAGSPCIWGVKQGRHFLGNFLFFLKFFCLYCFPSSLLCFAQ